MQMTATISECQRYRYHLQRTWDPSLPAVLFVGLNPSTADATVDDNTSRVCLNYAQRWGYGTVLMGNLFAYRSTDPGALKQVEDPVGPENDGWLQRLQAQADLVICAWGEWGSLYGRDQVVLAGLKDPFCLVKLTSGRPGHPLYKRRDLRPIPLDSVGC
jgi:hypothetical protein